MIFSLQVCFFSSTDNGFVIVDFGELFDILEYFRNKIKYNDR